MTSYENERIKRATNKRTTTNKNNNKPNNQLTNIRTNMHTHAGKLWAYANKTYVWKTRRATCAISQVTKLIMPWEGIRQSLLCSQTEIVSKINYMYMCVHTSVCVCVCVKSPTDRRKSSANIFPINKNKSQFNENWLKGTRWLLSIAALKPIGSKPNETWL